MNETEKLKVCPFCGGEASCNNRGLNDKNGNPVWWAECLSCGASIEGTENTKGAAMAAWNKRAQDTEAKRRRAEENPKPLTLDELIRMDGEPIWTVTIGLKGSGRWELCEGYTIRACPFKGALRCVDLSGEATLYDYKTYGKTWLAYRTKPEGSGE